MKEFAKEWQVETQGKVFDAEFEELKQWIAEGSILPADRVKRGDLRWLSVGKVPELLKIFNSSGYNAAENSKFEDEVQTQFKFENSVEEKDSAADEIFCSKHTNSEAFYACDACKNFFCKACPKSFGGSVKICPACDSLCRSVKDPLDIRQSGDAVNQSHTKPDTNGKDSGKQGDQPNFGFGQKIETAVSSVFSRLRR